MRPFLENNTLSLTDNRWTISEANVDVLLLLRVGIPQHQLIRVLNHNAEQIAFPVPVQANARALNGSVTQFSDDYKVDSLT